LIREEHRVSSSLQTPVPSATIAARGKPAPEVAPTERRWRLPRRLKITREGKYFIGITFGVGFAAINTGNNLLYLLLGLLLALIVVSSIMSEVSLRGLTVSRRLPTRAHVGRPHVVEIEVHNSKKRLPSYAIEIEDLRAGQPADKRCFFLKISPESSQVAAYRRTPTRRGMENHVGFRIATRFPFGFFEKSRELTIGGQLVIYPAIDPVRLPDRNLGNSESGAGILAPGRGPDILTVRPLREGDDVRDIYWRKSSLQVVVRERAQETQSNITLPLDNVPPVPPSASWQKRFERKLRDVASRAVAHIRRGDTVVVQTTSGNSVRGDRAVGADPVLKFLALLEPIPVGRESSLPPQASSRPNSRKSREKTSEGEAA
jgi:uncharacterized protein (DUF58 family)